jgi:hypothetical protein
MTLAVETDGSGNSYVTVGNIRISLVERPDGWAGPDYGHYIRVQAYKGDPKVSKELYPGAEFPIRDVREVCQLNAALNFLVANAFPR